MSLVTDTVALLDGRKAKFSLPEWEDLAANRPEVMAPLVLNAYAYLKGYTGDFDYLTAMSDRVGKGKSLSSNMAKGVVNCILAEARRGEESSVATSTPDPGHYALSIDGKMRFFHVNKHGFMTEMLGGRKRRLSRTELAAIIPLIEADPYKAVVTYGRETNRCGVCHTTLTDEASRRRGIGPVCAKRFEVEKTKAPAEDAPEPTRPVWVPPPKAMSPEDRLAALKAAVASGKARPKES